MHNRLSLTRLVCLFSSFFPPLPNPWVLRKVSACSLALCLRAQKLPATPDTSVSADAAVNEGQLLPPYITGAERVHVDACAGVEGSSGAGGGEQEREAHGRACRPPDHIHGRSRSAELTGMAVLTQRPPHPPPLPPPPYPPTPPPPRL